MNDQIALVLENAFPDRDVDSVGSTGPSWNEKNRTVRIDFVGGQTIYLKIAIDGDGTRIARERSVIAYVNANCEVPVPTVLTSDIERDIPYIATAPVSGQSLMDLWSDGNTEDRAALAHQVGTALARIYSRRFEAHGHITGSDGDDLEIETGPWTDILIDRINHKRDLSPSDRFDHHFDRVIAAVEANRALLNEAPAVLLHGDPAQPNCFRDEERIGFLDWEIAHVGDPVRDIRRTQYQQIDSLQTEAPDQLVTALYDGYREQAGGLPDGFEKRRPIYEAVVFLSKSGFFEKWADYADEPTEELARWVREEMNRRLDEIE
jgi:aminoglycoside phosphotransferase (APT) family kinase protein